MNHARRRGMRQLERASPLLDLAAAGGPTAPAAWADGSWDVVVIGGGNAALVAALTANDSGARVLVLERAPHHLRGGNTRHTRNVRVIHGGSRWNVGTYDFDELWNDLSSVGDGPSDEHLAAVTVRESESIPDWMSAHGVLWQPPLAGTLHLTRTNRFFLGGGKTLVNTYYRAVASRRNMEVVYGALVDDFEFEGDGCRAVIVKWQGSTYRVATRSVVCACGGFEANLDWLRRYWGSAVDNYIIRGTPCNDGLILARLYDAGAARAGQEKGFHAIAVDARAPRFDGGIATRLDTIPFGLVVNNLGRRFYDEGEEIWPKRYAIWGRLISEQPGQSAFSIWDSKVRGLFLPPMYPPTSANSIPELASALGLDAVSVTETVEKYNARVVRGSTFEPTKLDGCHTDGLSPAKSNWAQPLDTPPYYGVAMRPGITFTYMGAAVNPDARVRRTDGTSFANVYAAGEIMSGNILGTGYLAGFGLTIGSVWGRRAGKAASTHVR